MGRHPRAPVSGMIDSIGGRARAAAPEGRKASGGAAAGGGRRAGDRPAVAASGRGGAEPGAAAGGGPAGDRPGAQESGGNAPGGRGGPRSVVLPYRGGGEEPGLLRDFCETVMRSDVDELVIGIDRGESEYPEIAEACGRYGGRVRAVVVPPSPEWGSRFAAVLWRLIEGARSDLVLATNVDEVPSAEALGPPHRAGLAPGCVLESGPPEREWDAGPPAPGWTGTFWVWRPALGRYFDLRLYKRIRDGGDFFFFWSAVKAGLRYHQRKGPWITVRGGEHTDLGWVRWKDGLRASACAQEAWRAVAVHRRAARNLVAIRGLAGNREWWHLAGWLAGMARPNSYWAARARDLHGADWLHQGRLPYDDLWRRWYRRGPTEEAVVVHGLSWAAAAS